MICLFHVCCSTILSRTCALVTKSQTCGYIYPSWKASFLHSGVRTVNSKLLLTRLRVQCYSSKKSSGARSGKRKTDTEPLMKEDKEAFFVVRKGDLVGVYKSLSDCQAQVGTSIFDTPVSVYKGCSMPKDTEKYLLSCGLKNALYSIRASDLTEDLLEHLWHTLFRGEAPSELITEKRSQEASCTDYGPSCTLEFDGASKGNPGQAGAGAILRSDDGSLTCRLRQGLGKATCNVAEYCAFILGLKYALGKGFTNIRVRGDSQLVCMQGEWKVRKQHISTLYKEAKQLKDSFISFQVMHVLRDLNSEADAQANLAVQLAEGEIQEEIDKQL